jgi:hypothetical protein
MDEIKKPQHLHRINNSLVIDHMLKAIYHLQMAYNSAKNGGHNGEAWGIAIAIAEANAQAESMGCIPRNG